MVDALELLTLRVKDLNVAYVKQSAEIVHLKCLIADLNARFEKRVSDLEIRGV